ncbi:TetR/AcrR family transcriptional regulator [Photobacterium rosenbergii]|uniref:TetR/AcrR family transcriptional regulator n=1 Tax=Photobacterium rosenbergii TaxID=294936 RepID=A0ABU3ZIB7_9GAMM|nr:TetR/AcrR family transcriptional regulator [Photobacterium rosenbergii]MDV5169874.1 TetR/AcrR family transcriptional regulator [Photobacterium rosenbergii]
MANHAKFDRQQVIDKATSLYWEKGFHATSMRNLQDVIDMRPGSIYAAFGSKEGLFKEALQHYTEQGVAKLAACRANSPSPVAALKLFMEQLVINTQHGAPSGMCMLAKTVAELTGEHEELLQEAKRSFRKMESEFEKLIVEAQELGEIDKEKDPHQLARHIQVQISGLRTYARVNGSDDDENGAPLKQMIEDVFNHYPF